MMMIEEYPMRKSQLAFAVLLDPRLFRPRQWGYFTQEELCL